MNMQRKIYHFGDQLYLAEYVAALDAEANYHCWLDPETQKGYNYKVDFTLEEFIASPGRNRFRAVIMRKSDDTPIGVVSLSPEGCLPDLAIMLYPGFRGMGYGTQAFQLALEYCFNTFDFPAIYAGCYESNQISMKMLSGCGFVPHPEGNCNETHYLDGTPIVQLDFVKYRP